MSERRDDIKGTVAFLTGTASGIGLALKVRMVGLGARVFAVDIEEQSPSGALDYKADVSHETDVAAAIAACRDALGPIRYLIHVAGRVGRGPLTAMTLDDWHAGIAVNLTSAFLLTRGAYADLRATKGDVVLVSSPNGVHGGGALSGPAYAAAKAGIINLTRYLAKEWASDGIRVNCLVPGTVDTPMLNRLSEEDKRAILKSIPLGRFGEPDEMAEAIVFLCSSAARYMTGASVNITGGRLL